MGIPDEERSFLFLSSGECTMDPINNIIDLKKSDKAAIFNLMYCADQRLVA